jgi:rhodanese-related sulfurtransferase
MTVSPRDLGAAALILGALAAVAGEPAASSGALGRGVRDLAAGVEQRAGEVSPLQLALWIRDRPAGLRIVDLRSAQEFLEGHIPTAERRTLREELDVAGAGSDDTVVVYGAESVGAEAWVLLRLAGRSRSYFLSGGMAAWEAGVLHPVLSRQRLSPGELRRMADLSRYFGGAPRIGEGPEAISAPLGQPPTVGASPAAPRRRAEC